MKRSFLLSLFAALALAVPLAAQTYQITDIGALNGAPTYATAINDDGIVCGYALLDAATARAWVFDNSTLTELPGLGGADTRALAVGMDGRVYGYATDAGGLAHAVRWDNGVLADLGPASGTEGWLPQAVNASGLIAGHTGTATAPATAFTLSSGSITTIPALPGATPPATSAAYDLNDSGAVVGVSSWVGGGTRAFRTDAAGAPVSLGTLGANDSTAMSINSAGDVAGYSVNAANQTRAFVFTDAGGMRDLGVFTGHIESRAFAVNDTGLVVGTSEDAAGNARAFLWIGSGALLDLNPLIPPNGGWVLNAAQDINGGGDIVGHGTIGGETHAFIIERFEGLDTLAPIVSASVGSTLNGYVSSTVTVNFWDNEKVVGATTHAFGMIRITGPNGFDTLATTQSYYSADRQASTSTFIFTPPGGSWNGADNGTYEIRLAPNVVSDLAGNVHPGGVIGTFIVGVQTVPTLNWVTLPATATLGTAVDLSFGAFGSYPAAAGDLFTVAVDWDGDGAVVENFPGLASGAIISHAFASLGTHTVRVRVTDPNGVQSSERTAQIALSNTTPGLVSELLATQIGYFSTTYGAAVAEKDGRFYLFGGYPWDNDNTAAVTWDYLTPGAQFVHRGNLDNGPILPLGAGVDGRGRIVIYGGFEGGGEWTANAMTYTIAGGVGGGVADMPYAIGTGATARDHLGRLYAISSGAMFRYDAGASGNGAWATLAAPPAGFTPYSAAFDGAGRIIAFSNTAVRAYDIAGNSWTQLATSPAGIYGRAVAGADGLIYIVSGKQVWAFHPTLNSLLQIGTTLYDHNAYPLGLGGDGFVYLLGGNSSYAPDRASIERIDTRATSTRAPRIASPPTGTTLAVGAAWSYTPMAGGKPAPTFSLVRGPAGMTVNAATGVMSWTPAAAQIGTHTALLRASNSAGAAEQLITFTVLGTAPDTTPPNPVTGLAAFNITVNGVDLAWNAATDNVAVTAYRVKEKRWTGGRYNRHTYFATIGTTTGLSWHIGGLPVGSVKTYYVAAVDAAGNQSTLTSVTVALIAPPVISADQSGTFHGTRAIVSEPWTGNIITALGNPVPSLTPGTFPAGAVWHSISANIGYFTWTAAAGQEGAHTFTVSATNSGGSATFSQNVTVYPAGTDLIPPSYVGSLVVDQVSFDSCRATWAAATDNYGVVAYRVSAVHREPRRRFHRGPYNDHVVSLTVPATTLQAVIPGLRASTSYIVSVAATDAAGLFGYGLMRDIRTLLQPFIIAESNVTNTVNPDGSMTMTWPGYGYYWKFTVECSEDLIAWVPVEPASQWPSYITTFTFAPEPGVPARFYRVRATPAAVP